MATADVLRFPSVPKALFKPIIESSAFKHKLDNVEFDPGQHLRYEPPKSTILMTDIGYKEDTGISPIAVSEPFRLFSTEAIQKFRDECLSDEVFANYSVRTNIAACQLRGYAPKYAPFMYDAFHHPRTLEIISKVAGVELIPAMNYEIGHINISVKSADQATAEVAAVEIERKRHADDEGIAGCPWEDDKPIVGWHNDSYPFVCVTMLSDCTNMIGGETALRTADGNVMKVRGPEMGCAVVMQGRYITHQALRALGTQERITLVTSFRAKSPLLPDDSNLRTIRGISDISEVYYQFSKYRLEILEARIRDQLKRLNDAHAAGKKTHTNELKKFFKQQEQFLQHMNVEMIPDEEVIVGHQPKLDIPDVDTVEAMETSIKSSVRKAKKAKMS